MQKLLDENRLFLSCPWDMRGLILTNLAYGAGEARDRDVHRGLRDAEKDAFGFK